MFECACGQIARSRKAFDTHPRGRYCEPLPVKQDLEERPVEFDDRQPEVTRYPKIGKDEVFK